MTGEVWSGVPLGLRRLSGPLSSCPLSAPLNPVARAGRSRGTLSFPVFQDRIWREGVPLPSKGKERENLSTVRPYGMYEGIIKSQDGGGDGSPPVEPLSHPRHPGGGTEARRSGGPDGVPCVLERGLWRIRVQKGTAWVCGTQGCWVR